jgi:riboflavin kinase/FMN adenylyltransferase
VILINQLPNFNKKDQSCVTIGSFDGVHKGHIKIIENLVASAKREGMLAVVLTFYPHPRKVVQPETKIELLNSLEEKAAHLESLGVDYLVVYPFTEAFSRLSPEAYVKDILVNGLHCKKIIIGYDHRFGRNRKATLKDLVKFGEEYNFNIEKIEAQQLDQVAISSTKIRQSLHEGDIEKANHYLGYAYTLSGNVVTGNRLGRKINFPTANLSVSEKDKLIPKEGVYVVKSFIDGNWVYGMMNIGTNPTVSGKGQNIEVHFFNFSGDLYKKELQVKLLKRLRDEQRFESIDALKIQLENDREQSIKWIGNKISETED